MITIDLNDDQKKFRDLIPEQKDATLVDVSCVNKDHFVVVYKRNASHFCSPSTSGSLLLTRLQVQDEIYIYSKRGVQLVRLASDFVGAASVSSRETHSHFFVTMTGFDSPGTLALYDFSFPEEQRWSIYRSIKVNGLVPSDFEARQVRFYNGDI
jgi:prolyl oligopeptidase